MSSEIYKGLIYDIAKSFNVDEALIVAIVMVESSGHPMKVRFEPAWKYLYKVDEYAKSLNITSETEKVLQSCSWGLMQVMGSVCRELGYKSDLPGVCDPTVGLHYGAKKLKALLNKYDQETDAIAAYNAGIPKLMANGKYFNQVYVDKVTKNLINLRGKK